MRQVVLAVLLILTVLRSHGQTEGDDVYLKPEAFLNETFATSPNGPPTPSLLWLSRDIRSAVHDILGHDYPALRIRYWRAESVDGAGTRTAWILEEIGKVKPITAGLVVRDGALEEVKVLIYRESHGWEVKHPFFTNQFRGAALDKSGRLTQQIDGIAGATLSVDALTRLGRLALVLHDRVTMQEGLAAP
ncbi:MAG: FMN-binding protein [Opitutaceae bacterium]